MKTRQIFLISRAATFAALLVIAGITSVAIGAGSQGYSERTPLGLAQASSSSAYPTTALAN